MRSGRLLAALVMGTFTLVVGMGCHKSDDAKPVVVSNPVAPPAVALSLTGKVVKADSTAIAGATVTVAKTNGTAVGSALTTAADGSYILDVSTLTDTSLVVTATATGYGSMTATATLDRTNNQASVPNIILSPVVTSTPATVTPTTSGTTSTPSTESATTTPLAVTVPANSASTSISITVAALPVDDVPPPPNATTQNLLVAAKVTVTPSTATFSQAFTITFPLPMAVTASSTISAMKLNETTNAWATFATSATVDATGLVATLPVTTAGTYALVDAVGTDVTGFVTGIAPDGWLTEQTAAPMGMPLAPAEQMFALSSGSRTITLTCSNTYTRASATGSAPSDIWVRNLISQVLRIPFGSYPQSVILSFPGLPANYIRDGRSYNPALPNDFGQWEYRYYFEDYTTTVNGRVLKLTAPAWTVNFSLSGLRWRLKSTTGWYWVSLSGATS
jgi:hypothetical protein